MKKVMELSREVEDRFGSLPDPARTLFDMVRIRILAEQLGADEVNVMAARMELGFAADHAARDKMLALAAQRRLSDRVGRDEGSDGPVELEQAA
ncbi:MAG: hypothetical protein IPH10_12880 [bacterium]|nr:hypothetical protein [bacterium]